MCEQDLFKNPGKSGNVSLVESESCAPLIPLVGELMDSKVISTSFFSAAKHCTPEIRHGAENFKP